MRIPLLGLALLLAGCSNDSSQCCVGSPTAAAGTTPRQLIFRHDHVQESGPGSALPADYDLVSITALDESGAELSRSSHLATDADQVFNVPAQTHQLRLEYFQDASERSARGDFLMPVPGSTTCQFPPCWGGGPQLELVGDPTAPVHVVKTLQANASQQSHLLLVNDRPTFLQGAGFDYTTAADANGTQWFSYVSPDLAAAKCNTVRTYGVGWNFANVQQQTANLSAMLAQAKASNFYVLAGLVYDTGQGDMTTLIPQTTVAIQQDPNYDRLLGWCIGNEVQSSQFTGLNSVILQVKNQMTTSELVRPVMTALPAVSTGFVSTINSQLSNIDWLAINNFYGQYSSSFPGPGGFLNTQAADLAAANFSKPWLISEYYTYDLGTTLGIPSLTLNGQTLYQELNSTQNAANYSASWQYVLNARAQGCVGGLALNWGPPHNSQLPAFFKMMYAYRGELKPFTNPPWSVSGFDRFECVDAVAKLYGGSVSSNPCPQIVLPPDNDPQGLNCSFKGTSVAAGTSLTASVSATDANPLTYDWYLIGGAPQNFAGNITLPNKNPQNYGATTSQLLSSSASNTVTFNAPQAPGNNYQLRVIVRDGQGGAATAVVPFGINP